jgi:hypothetical protein
MLQCGRRRQKGDMEVRGFFQHGMDSLFRQRLRDSCSSFRFDKVEWNGESLGFLLVCLVVRIVCFLFVYGNDLTGL